MIRKSLYLAASAAALIASAGAANAGEINGTGQFDSVSSTTASVAYKLASQLSFSATATSAAAFAATRGALTFDFLPTSAFTTGQSLLLTLDLSNAIFSGSGVTVFGTGTCVVDNLTNVTAATANATTATYLVTLSGTCAGSANGVSVSLPVQATGGGSVQAGIKLEQSFGGSLLPVDGGRSVATFVQLASILTTATGVSASSTNATALVANGYRQLNAATPTIATVTVGVDTTVNSSLSATSAATTTLIDNVDFVITATSGSFNGVNVQASSAAFTSSSTATSATVRVLSNATTTGSYTIALVDNTDTATTAGILADGVISASNFTLAATVDFTSASGLSDVTVSGATAGISRDGTSFVAPWLAMGSGSTSSVIRLANNGSEATGPITVRLLSTINGQSASGTFTITSAQVQAGSLTGSGGIPAGSAVAISVPAIASALGITAGNGDLEVAVEAQPQFISGKVRNTTTQGTYEITLGNLSTGS